MNRLKSKQVLLAAALLALLVGAGGAIAASKGSTSSGDGFLARVAGHLGISTQKLQDATKAAAIDQVDADLKAGRITQAQADRMKARIKAGGAPLFFGGPHRFGDFGHRMLFAKPLAGAADYLGLTEAQLRQQLSGGKTLADVAKAQNKSVDGLKQAMIDSAQKTFDQAVKDGRLTQSHANEEMTELKNRIDGIVNGTLRGPGRHEEFRFRGGPASGAGMPLVPAA
jgi:hypothetical protein